MEHFKQPSLILSNAIHYLYNSDLFTLIFYNHVNKYVEVSGMLEMLRVYSQMYISVNTKHRHIHTFLLLWVIFELTLYDVSV